MSESLIDLDVYGLDELDKQLDAFEPELRRRCIAKGVAAAATHIAELAQDKAPVMAEAEGSRRVPGELRDDIGVIMEPTWVGRPERVGAIITPFYDGSGPQSPGVWGAFVEYGSVHNPDPRPFMRPACDEGAEASIDIFVATVSEAMASIPDASLASAA